MERLMIGLLIVGLCGVAFALVGVPFTEAVLMVAVPTTLWVVWPETMEQWRRFRRGTHE